MHQKINLTRWAKTNYAPEIFWSVSGVAFTEDFFCGVRGAARTACGRRHLLSRLAGALGFMRLVGIGVPVLADPYRRACGNGWF